MKKEIQETSQKCLNESATHHKHKKEVFPVKEMIAEAAEKLKRKLEVFFEEPGKTLDEAERYLGEEISRTVCKLLGAYYEKLDTQLREDKVGRREDGLVVERRGEKREVISLIGTVRYKRTYYRRRAGGYEYPVDAVVGLEPYQRVSGGVGQALVETCCKMSYGKSSEVVTGGRVSRQAVMHKVRQSAVPEPPAIERKHVAALHIDADEDHVTMVGGKNSIVPLVNVYEGIEKRGKRGICRNKFNISEFGKKPEELWEEVLDEIERRYDLEGTTLYLHGDGAPWIKQGLEWLPKCKFVLDRYHKNKALKQAVSGMPRDAGAQYDKLLRTAFAEDDKEFFSNVVECMVLNYPEREEKIREATDYLLDNFDAITICSKDPEATNGGATEPHVSNTLSARISSRPMAWSAETLRHLVPILAAGRCELRREAQESRQTVVPLRKLLQPHGCKVVEFPLGLADPDTAVSLPGRTGKVTPLFNALRPF